MLNISFSSWRNSALFLLWNYSSVLATNDKNLTSTFYIKNFLKSFATSFFFYFCGGLKFAFFNRFFNFHVKRCYLFLGVYFFLYSTIFYFASPVLVSLFLFLVLLFDFLNKNYDDWKIQWLKKVSLLWVAWIDKPSSRVQSLKGFFFIFFTVGQTNGCCFTANGR